MNGDIHDSTIMLFVNEESKHLPTNAYVYLPLLAIYLSTVALGLVAMMHVG